MRKLAWILGVVGFLLVLPVMLWYGYPLYKRAMLDRGGGTTGVIKTNQGDVALGLYRAGDQVLPGETPAPTPTAVFQELALPTPTARPILPPTRIGIPTIAVDAPVVLADNDNLPQFKAVGWYFGTGYPGFRGNMVLFGHVNGDNETFSRLGELKPGDELVVKAMTKTYRYVVSESKIVPREAVEVMAPTPDFRATLITCTGTFFPLTRDYSHRLVVTALLTDY